MQPAGDRAILESIEERILAFVRSEVVGPEIEIGVDDDLLSGELLNSIAVLRLATFVAEEFSFEIEPADFVIENFRSVSVLGRYVRRATGGEG